MSGADNGTDTKELLQQIDALEMQLQETENRLALVNVELAERDRLLDEIRSSTGWALLQVLWQLRTRVVPHGGQRDQWLFRGISAARASVGVATKARRRFTSRDGGTAEHPRVRVEVPAYLTVASKPRPRRYDVIVLPIIDWHFRYQRPQQLASQFASRGHRVFYVSATFQGGTSAVLRSLARGVVEVKLPGPPGLDIYTSTLSEQWRELQTEALGLIGTELSIEAGVCVVDLPFWAPLAFRLRDRLGWKIVYDCMDFHAGFGNVHPRMVAGEDTLVRESDLVLVTSNDLLERVKSVGADPVLVPNAADFEHFRFAPPVRPGDLPPPGQPIVGYYGAISEWFDAELVERLARARAEWQFVLIGNTTGSSVASLRRLPNVRFLGEQLYSSLPAYLHAFDVCLIPFKKTPLTDATNPVKLFEYLSAGKPVVASDLDELRHYGEHIRIATTPDDWLGAIDAALASTSANVTEQRISFARRNTWDARVQTISGFVEAMFKRASIIVVTYNNLDYNKLCLNSIYEKTHYPDFEVIVVDNNSTDGTREFLIQFERTHPGLRVILNDHNVGFAAANNQGIDIATGDYIVFLNNDTIVTPGWLSRLIYYLGDPAIGMVGPVTNWSGNESRIEVAYASPEGIDAFATNRARRHASETFDIKTLALFCAALRRGTVDSVGRLDERFGIGMFEDDDYAVRVHHLGLRTICAEDVFIHHWGRASFARLDEQFYRDLFEENRRKFEDKWGMKWEPHRARQPGDAVKAPAVK
jgi:GT2 family glycosyltransferase/glycosyltransferase involved in cell wall biosynthesis